jgi:tRNA (guanine-N7-)-methyltransferase
VEPHRPIRSYVLRQGRISHAQSRAYNTLLSQYGIIYRDEILNLDQVFSRTTTRVLEIGFGMGEATADIALQNTGTDYIVVDVHSPGVGSLLRKIEALSLKNVRIVQHDAVAVLRHMIPQQSLDGVHIFFPDPWPKTRHHKRRLIQTDFVTLLCEKLKSNGTIHIATDWQDYARHIKTVCANEPSLIDTTQSLSTSRPNTKFEQRGLKLGHEIYEWIFQKSV